LPFLGNGGGNCYRGVVLSKVGARISPLTPGRWLTGLALPLMAGWITAAVMSNTDLFFGPFFWVFTYMLVIGIWLVMWGAVTTPIRTERPRAVWGVLLEEVSLGVAALGLFWALVCN
jgi:hypothetical protein